MKKEYIAPFSKMVNIKVNTRLLSGSDKIMTMKNSDAMSSGLDRDDEEDGFGW